MYLADRFRDSLANGGRALIAGLAAEQLPTEYRHHPRVVIWDSDDPHLSVGTRLELPVRVRAVVVTRFMKHSTFNQLSKAAKRTDAVFFGKLSGSGEIARMLREAFPQQESPTNGNGNSSHTHHNGHEPVTTTAAPPPPPQPPQQFKSITDVVRFYATPEITRPLREGQQRSSPLREEFFVDLATKVVSHGFDTDAGRVRALFGNARVQYFANLRKTTAVTPTTPEIAVGLKTPPGPEPPADPIVVAPVDIPPVVAEPLPPDLDALVNIANDLDYRGLQAVELADHLRRVVAELRGLRSIKTKYDALVSIVNTGTED